MEMAPRTVKSKRGNSWRAPSDAEYTEAPDSLTRIEKTGCRSWEELVGGICPSAPTTNSSSALAAGTFGGPGASTVSVKATESAKSIDGVSGLAADWATSAGAATVEALSAESLAAAGASFGIGFSASKDSPL